MNLIILGVCFLIAEAGLGDNGIQIHGPVAVIALVSEQDLDLAVDMAAAIQRKLAEKIDVLPVKEVRSRLGGVGPPHEDLERLRGLFQQGYLQSYKFEYQKSIDSLTKLLASLERVPDRPARWELYIKSKIFLGKSQLGLKNTDKAYRAFQAVLRTRPDLELSLKEHSPRTIEHWNEARKGLAGLPRGKLVVTTDPEGAEVFLDGVKVGETPYIGEFPRGRYSLFLWHPDAGGLSRQLVVGDQPVPKRFNLVFEGALKVGLAHPAVRIPAGGDTLPPNWWMWLGARLRIRRLAVVRHARVGEHRHWIASLVDLERGRIIREGWLEPSGADPEHRAVDVIDLTDFLVSGRETKRVAVRSPSDERKSSPAPSGKARAGRPGTEVDPRVTGQESPLQVDLIAVRPLSRTWWPYAIGGAAALGGGVAAHVASEKIDTRFSSNQDVADTWLGIAIGGYVIAGALTLTGVILHLSYELDEDPTQHALVPSVGPGGVGLQWVGTF